MINIDDKTRRLSQATIVIGYKQENKAESIEFKIPDYLKEYGKKICFRTKDGKVFSKLFDNITSNIFTFTRTETQYGELDATIQFFKAENEDMIIYKTSLLHIIFKDAVICEDEVQPDDPKYPILEDLIIKVANITKDIENIQKKDDEQDTKIQANETDIEDIKKEQVTQNNDIIDIKKVNKEQDNDINKLYAENEQLKNQIPNGTASGNAIHIEDSSDLELKWKLKGGHKQEIGENSPSPNYPSEIKTVNGSVKIDVVNKNLFDKNNANKLTGYIDNTGFLHYDTNNKIIYVKCKTNTDYVISSKSIKGVAFFNKVPKSGLTSTNFKILNTTELTLNSKENTYLACWYYTSTLSLTEQEILNSIQIEQGLKATAYVEHQSQTVTMPIQQEMLEGDYIDDVEHHEWGKVILTGNDFNYIIQQNGKGLNYFIFRHPLVKIKGRIVSNMLKNNVDIWDTTQYIDGVTVSKSQNIINIMLSDTTITTAKQFKTKLQELYNAGTPILLYYKLATPLNLELTEEQKKVREQKLHTYKNVTNINLSDELVSIDVTYKKDLETMFNNIIKQMPSDTSDTTET